QVRAVRQGDALAIETEAVFVCCGAIETPALLRRSRIKKNIGNSLAFHPTVKVVAGFEDGKKREAPAIGAQQDKKIFPPRSIGWCISSRTFLPLGVADQPGSHERKPRTSREM